MKIAICDDDALDLQSLQSMIREYDAALDITTFNAASELLRAFESVFYDIVFMDIEMEHPNGYEAAKILMEKNAKPLIIFVTNSGEYTIRGYGIAFRYLPKPLASETVFAVLNLAIERVSPQTIEIDVYDKKMFLSVRDIYYIEAKNHVVLVNTKEDTYRCRASLKGIEQRLPTTGFARPHNSYIVNLNEVNTSEKFQLVMTNGAAVPISQRYARAFDLALTQFIRRR